MYPKLLVQLLLPLALATLTLAAKNPLCEGAMAGTFNGSLLSITWAGTRVLNFVLDQVGFIEVNPSAVEKEAINLKKGDWNAVDYRRLFYETWWKQELDPNGKLKSFYEICIVSTCISYVHMDSELYMLDSDPSWRLMYWKGEAPSESYSIILYKVTDRGYTYGGYVITRDLLDKTGHLVILELAMKDDGGTPSLTDPPIFSHPKFYYLDGKYSNQITLLHRNHLKHETIKSPFNEPPHGFLKDGLMYLFDDQLGCVRIAKFDFNLDSMFDKDRSLVTFPMVSVPYEMYFKCPEQFKPKPGLDPHRCGPLETRSGFLSPMGHVSLMVAGLIALALLLAGAALCFVWVKSKKKKAGSRAAKRSSSSHSKSSRSASKDSRGKASRSGSKASRGASAGSKAA